MILHTLNFRDFSAPDNHAKPHADIANLFTNGFSYSYGIEHLMELLRSSQDAIQAAQDVDANLGRCWICDSTTLLDEATCSKCGMTTFDLPDHEGYSVQKGNTGVRIVEHVEDPRGKLAAEERALTCPECGGQEFEASYLPFCSYHQWSFDKND